MASESAEEATVTVNLGPELEEWLEARAAALGVDRETVLLRLVATSRAADVDGDADADDLAAVLAEADPVRDAVAAAADDLADERMEAVVQEHVTQAVDEAVDEAVDTAADDAVDEAVEDAIQTAVEDAVGDAVEAAVADRLQDVEANFQAKIEDVRERVIQVKREADARAPADHDHEALGRVDAIGGRLADAEEAIADLESTVEAVEADLETAQESAADERATTTETVEQLQDRLKTVAWVVSDLREAHERRDGSAALEQLKRAAASADVARANCEQCGEGVELALLTQPSCPHCDATVTDVEPAAGFFGNPQLLVASQLESGDQQ